MFKSCLFVLLFVAVAIADTTWCHNIGAKQLGFTTWRDSTEVCTIWECRWEYHTDGSLVLKNGNSVTSYAFVDNRTCSQVAIDWDSSKIWFRNDNNYVRFDFNLNILDIIPNTIDTWLIFSALQNTSVVNVPSVVQKPKVSNNRHSTYDLTGRVQNPRIMSHNKIVLTR